MIESSALPSPVRSVTINGRYIPGLGNGNTNGPGRGSGKAGGGPGDRLPPQNLEAERSVLGSILLDNEVLHDVVIFLRVEDFYRDAHQVIYAAIRDLYDKGKGIDAVTLAEELKHRDQFEQVGGDDISDRDRRRAFRTRPMASTTPDCQGEGDQPPIDRKCHRDHPRRVFQPIYSGGTSRDGRTQDFRHRGGSDQGRNPRDQGRCQAGDGPDRGPGRFGGHAVTGIASGLIDLDDITWGFQPGQLIILAARPSMGKTALALNICDHAAVNLKLPVLFVSLEMGYLEIAERLLCAPFSGRWPQAQDGQGPGNPRMKELSKAYSELAASGQIFIDDTPARNMLQIAASARRLAAQARSVCSWSITSN